MQRLLALLLLATSAFAQDAAVERALERYKDIRPDKAQLRMYQLDWAPDYATALERAQEENRPIFLVRIYAQYGDFWSGHC